MIKYKINFIYGNACFENILIKVMERELENYLLNLSSGRDVK